MKIVEPGHIYELNCLDTKGYADFKVEITFVNREPGHEHPGTQTQEVLRALIDRTRHCHNCLPWPGNDLIIWHLQQALVLHEARALERKAAKGIIRPELIETGADGHFSLSDGPVDYYAAPVADPVLKPDVSVKCHRDYPSGGWDVKAEPDATPPAPPVPEDSDEHVPF